MITIWTDDEVKYLLEHYATDGLKKCSLALGKSESTIKRKAKAYGLRWIDPNKYTDEEIEFIKKNYKRHTAEWLAKKLNRPLNGIYIKLSRMGLHRMLYSEKESHLIAHYSYLPNESIAKIVGRSPEAIKTYRCRYEIGTQIDNNCESYTITEAARLLGFSSGKMFKMFQALKVKTRKSGTYRFIDIDNFLKFMQEHPDRWDATKCEAWLFEDYEWFRKKRMEDRKKMIEARWGNVI